MAEGSGFKAVGVGVGPVRAARAGGLFAAPLSCSRFSFRVRKMVSDILIPRDCCVWTISSGRVFLRNTI